MEAEDDSVTSEAGGQGAGLKEATPAAVEGDPSSKDVTASSAAAMDALARALQEAASSGQADPDRLFEEVYPLLHGLAHRAFRGQPQDHTLQPTALLSEAFLRIAHQRGQYADADHFLASVARVMRSILVDYARRRSRLKRGGDRRRLPLEHVLHLHEEAAGHDVVDVNAALESLAERYPAHVEIIDLRFFAGLTVGQIAELHGCGRTTVEAKWRLAKRLLQERLA